MKIVFLSSYYNHHQASLSYALKHLVDDGYCFISTREMSDDRRSLGYKMEYNESFIAFLKNQKEECINRIKEADVAIIGTAPQKLIQDRIAKNKLIFRYSERPLKKGAEPIKYFPRLFKWHIQNPQRKQLYLLCASAYTASDYARFGLFKNRAYRWGYFPETVRYESIDSLISEKKRNELLWCGRFLDLKHPDDAVRIAKKLRNEGYSFSLNFIGRGEKEEELLHMIEQEGLSDCVRLLGAMSPEAVRAHMEKSGIFLFTSDKQEGWGAVLNESMNSGCAVVASHAIGSVPFLIEDGENGCIYESGNIEMLYEKVKYLLDHPDEQKRLGTKAYHTIVDEWNAEVAAERLLNLAQHILDGEKTPDLYESGPCSRAPRLTDKWAGKDIN